MRRGFWLYVWEVAAPSGTLHYVGRTGDNSSPYATAPYTRMGQHLGSVKSQNALRQHLARRGHEPTDCTSFNLVTFGPLFEEAPADGDREARMQRHLPIRDTVGALEKKLAEALASAGYAVLNTVKWRHVHDPILWEQVKAGFAQHFPALGRVA